MIGLLMLLGPVVLFVMTIPLSGKLKSGLRRAYLIFGGGVVFAGGGTSFYLASYTGDQGGIAAYFFQIGVIFVYALLLIIIAGTYLVASIRTDRRKIDDMPQ